MTFSIVARCARTGQFGVAVSSSSPAVAARCAFTRAGVGAVATQNITDPRLGPRGLDLLGKGVGAEAALARLLSDAAYPQYRQLSIVDVAGDAAVWSGPQTLGVHAAVTGRNVACAGNLLANADVPAVVREAFLASDQGDDLAARLLVAIEAGLAAGGEAGPVMSAGMLVADRQSWPLVDLRVDWDEAPIRRLRALWSLWRGQMHDYVTRGLNPTLAPAYGVPGDEG